MAVCVGRCGLGFGLCGVWASRVRAHWWLSLQGLGSFFMLSVIPQVPTSSPYGWQYVKVVHQVSYGFAKHLSMKIGL